MPRCSHLLDPDLRARAVSLLRRAIQDEDKPLIRESIKESPNEWMLEYHFNFGMWVHNQLRILALDSELPVCYHETGYQGWDDYWSDIVEESVREEPNDDVG